MSPETTPDSPMLGSPEVHASEDKKKPLAYFSTGPDKYLRKCRPYFWVPLNMRPDRSVEIPIPYKKAVEDITNWLHDKNASGENKRKPVTDVFVISHGWHRNLFVAAAAYDRLLGRFITLFHTGRLRPKEEPFEPLFLTLHWHSDPGPDAWLDKLGRRNKASFMSNVAEIFEVEPKPVSEGHFTRDFERLFDLLSRMSSTPDDPASMVDSDLLKEGLDSLENYRLKEQVVPLELAEKVTLVWMCYHESVAHGPLRSQTDSPEKVYFGPLQALQTGIRFVLAVLGIGTIVTPLAEKIGPYLWTCFEYPAIGVLERLGGTPDSSWVMKPVVWGITLFLMAIASALCLIITGSVFLILTPVRPNHFHEWDDDKEIKAGRPVPRTAPPTAPANPVKALLTRGSAPMLAICWLHVQLWCALPFICVCLFTFFTGGLFKRRIPDVNDERFGRRGKASEQLIGWFKKEEKPVNCVDPSEAPRPRFTLRSGCAELARKPARRLQRSVAPDSFLAPIADLIDEQLAFYEMQFYGVASGAQAAQALVALLEADAKAADAAGKKTGQLDGAKFHFIGHSFGCLVVANAVRHLHYDHKFDRPIKTIALLQAAFGSDWFQGENALIESVEGNIACVFSRYDTATGFFYPLANRARFAAGNMGLARGPKELPQQTHFQDRRNPDSTLPKLVMLIEPPALNLQSGRNIVNLDASRIVYAGSAAQGGAHNDIFKDDVLHLLWAACDLKHFESQPNGKKLNERQ